jgi:tetratricopeptide (TPR) repeat protein
LELLKDTAQAHIDVARRFYEGLEYERAMEELDRAQRRARTQDEFSSILLHEGVILAELGRAEEAAAAFQASLSLRPGATLPLVVSPKIQKQFDAARQEAQYELARANPKPPPAPSSSPPPAPAAAPMALATTAPLREAPAGSVENSPLDSRSIERNVLARRIAGFEARLREPREPALPAGAGAQLKDLRKQLGEALTAQMRSNVAVKLDRWELRYFPPPEPPALIVEEPSRPAIPPESSSAPAEPPSPLSQSIERDALARRLKECEAQLRQKNGASTGPALTQLKDIRQQLARAITPQLRMSVAVSLDRWERRFLSAQ